jgi:type I restriction enzyme M protein
LVLSKHKTENTTQFIDASGEDFFRKVTNNNELTDAHIQKIMDIFDSKQDVDYIARSVDNSVIAANDYNLSVSSYITPKDNREQVDITKLNAEITETVKKINKLRTDIDAIIKEIEA